MHHLYHYRHRHHRCRMHMQAMQHEVLMLRSLHHENIVRYLGTERTGDTLSIFLEYVPGGSVRSLLERFGCFEEAVIRIYARQLLLGLEYLHSNGIAHRDIKGGNVLVSNDGRIKLADFGASTRLHQRGTAGGTGAYGGGQGATKGTPLWMAPEVIASQHYNEKAVRTKTVGERNASVLLLRCRNR